MRHRSEPPGIRLFRSGQDLRLYWVGPESGPATAGLTEWVAGIDRCAGSCPPAHRDTGTVVLRAEAHSGRFLPMATRTRCSASRIARGALRRPDRQRRDLLSLEELSYLRLEPSDLFALLSSDHGEVDHIGGELANGFGLVLRREGPQSRFDHLGCACHSRARYAPS